MTDGLIDRLAGELHPVPPRAIERRLVLALVVGVAVTALAAYLVLHVLLGRPFGGAFGGPMFWTKLGYTLALGLVGFAAAPALSRPDGHISWPWAASAALVALALSLGTMGWMHTGWAMTDLMGGTALVCPWLILLTGLPILATLFWAMRGLAPRSPTMAGFAAGLVAGGLGAWVYAFYCGETGMMFMAVWYTLGIMLTAALGAILGRMLLRW